MIYRILLSIFVVTILSSCSSSRKVTDNPDSQRLIFGSGGGFTGIYTSYELNDNGRVFEVLSDSSQNQVNRIRKKQTRGIFAQASKLTNEQPVFNHPGNMTWFIRYYSGNELIELKWGDSNVIVPIEIKNLYNELITIVK